MQISSVSIAKINKVNRNYVFTKLFIKLCHYKLSLPKTHTHTHIYIYVYMYI